jgi:hypothetical protein|tara:strand:+ start:43 stop:168 length:126 start_codon:yes stop_codon:yes gene_type:complete
MLFLASYRDMSATLTIPQEYRPMAMATTLHLPFLGAQNFHM